MEDEIPVDEVGYSDEELEESDDEVELLMSDDESSSEDKDDKTHKLSNTPNLYKARLSNPVVKLNRVKTPKQIVIKIVAPDDRVTSEIITLPEMTEAIGIRCSEIENGAPCFAADVEGYISPIDRARKEFLDRKSPLIIQRAIEQGPGYKLVEEWKVREMTFPITRREILAINIQKKNEAKNNIAKLK